MARFKCACFKCKEQRRLYQIGYRKLKPESYINYNNNRTLTYRRKEIVKRFGLTVEKYNEMLALQNGVCAICANTCNTGRNLAIDHNHETGAIRGLLCTKCNQGIGQFNENKELFFKAVEYLERYKNV